MVDSSLLEEGPQGEGHSEGDGAGASSADRQQAWQQLQRAHAILVPGGFGVRGIGEHPNPT